MSKKKRKDKPNKDAGRLTGEAYRDGRDEETKGAEADAQSDTAPEAYALNDPQPQNQNTHELFEGDQGNLPAEARRALTLLIRDPYVCALEDPDDFEAVLTHQAALIRELNNLGLELLVSRRYEVAYARQVSTEAGGPLMIKRAAPLLRDATILLVSIRARQHNDEANGEDVWFVSKEDLQELLSSGPYSGELDGSRVEKALKSAIKQLEEAGYIKETTAKERYRVMPILPATFTLERARELLEALTPQQNR